MSRQAIARWCLLAAIAAACLAAAVLLWRSAGDESAAQLLSRLPQTDRLLAGIDVEALRKSGWLAKLGGTGGQEQDYLRFVQATGFDYKRDLDRVLLSYSNNDVYYVLQGSFQWARIQDYARRQAGKCDGAVCRMPASSPGRTISFQRLGPRTLAMATSTDDSAVLRLRERSRHEPPISVPPRPVWLSIPRSILKSDALLPAGSRTFASALTDSERVMLTAGPREHRFELTLEARCQSAEQANATKRELEAATTLLKRAIAREKQTPNPKGLSGILTRGEFRTEENLLFGAWPVELVFLEQLAGSAP